MIKFVYVVPEDEEGFTKYIEVTLYGYKSGQLVWSYTRYSNEILSRTFLGQSEQMLLVTFLAMSFHFGSAEIQMRCTIQYLE